ncbi:dephospho-CoA kinase [Flavobacteriaceae bacterium]|mgnify:FL=1|jgi:dephospho-CoA kinase|nr:dephospho-CoA kinase [Flavobacteriaceae bacterium]
MKVVGLTGGIGSGKTTVLSMFLDLGVPVYIADIEAKKLTNTSKVIRKKIIALLGKNSYLKTEINKKYVADIIFNDDELLKKVNKIIHSKVAHHFKKWVDKQNGVYCIKETAILFESASYKLCDYTILITSPKEERLKRVKNRDQLTRKEIENRMNHQWSDIEKSQLADVVIENVHLKNTQKKVEEVHLFLLKRFD